MDFLIVMIFIINPMPIHDSSEDVDRQHRQALNIWDSITRDWVVVVPYFLAVMDAYLHFLENELPNFLEVSLFGHLR